MENPNNWVDWLYVQRKLVVGGGVTVFPKIKADILNLFFETDLEHLTSEYLASKIYPQTESSKVAYNLIANHIAVMNKKLNPLGLYIDSEHEKGRRLVGYDGIKSRRVGLIQPASFEPDNAPSDRPFVGLLSNGVFSVLSKPHPQSEYADFWTCGDGYTVPINPTSRKYAGFIALASWCEISQEMHAASAKITNKTLEFDGMKDANFTNSATSGDM